ncbi:hypothetical protein C8Q78DRAFT_247583 [Trametes maxima]|nr:hypothetical protein C8Q78DRAFT_247583 [Trametes maxima]
MDLCPLPIEIWEYVMEIVSDIALSLDFFNPEHSGLNRRLLELRQSTLYACMLSCRAWKIRARALLWAHPNVSGQLSASLISSPVRHGHQNWTSYIMTMRMQGQDLGSTRMGDLLIIPIPQMRALAMVGVRFSLGSRLLRMPLPFFGSLTRMRLEDCWFDTIRAMLDVVWACTNLSGLAIRFCRFRHAALPVAIAERLSSISCHG